MENKRELVKMDDVNAMIDGRMVVVLKGQGLFRACLRAAWRSSGPAQHRAVPDNLQFIGFETFQA